MSKNKTKVKGKSKTQTKTYKHYVDANKGKLFKIENLTKMYRKEAISILSDIINHYLTDRKILTFSDPRYINLYKGKTILSQKQYQCLTKQLNGMFKSKISNFTNYFKNFVSKNLKDIRDKNDKSIIVEDRSELRHKMFTINILNLFNHNQDFIHTYGVNKHILIITREDFKLARWIFNNFIGQYPSVNNLNLSLKEDVAGITKAKNIDKSKYSHVVHLSCLPGDGKPIDILLKRNKHFQFAKGTMCESCSINIKNGKVHSISLYKESVIDKINQLEEKVIAIDLGLNVYMALDNGNKHGLRFAAFLKRQDNKILTLQKKLQKSDKHYRLSENQDYNNLIRKTREAIKNEVNRIVNVIVKKYNPTKIILEDLRFSGKSNYGVNITRRLHNMGIGALKDKLAQIEIDYNIEIDYVKPMFTSQTCSKCTYIDKKSRVNDRFECKCCKSKMDADINAARNLKLFKERFLDRNTYDHKFEMRRKEIAEYFIAYYLSNKSNRNLFWMSSCSVARLLASNYYFKQILIYMNNFYDVFYPQGVKLKGKTMKRVQVSNPKKNKVK